MSHGVGNEAVVRPRRVCRARHGGVATQLVFTACHCFLHLATAISLMLILELAVETCIRCVQATLLSFSLRCGRR